jgi:hypothetical protein
MLINTLIDPHLGKMEHRRVIETKRDLPFLVIILQVYSG